MQKVSWINVSSDTGFVKALHVSSTFIWFLQIWDRFKNNNILFELFAVDIHNRISDSLSSSRQGSPSNKVAQAQFYY